MSRKSKPSSLFKPVVSPERLCESFVGLSTFAQGAPSRAMMDELFLEFDDVDGNFVEQFQTTGFDARVWELYLFALFSRSGFKVRRRADGADFLLEKDGVTFAAEAVTANPSQTATTTDSALSQPNAHDIFAIKLGSSLTSKLAKRYWEDPAVAGKPLVLCVAAFFDSDALSFSASGLQIYLYGASALPGELTSTGYKTINVPLNSHENGKKVIPSGFFGLPDAQHVSAVLFSNAGTTAKFNRMGHQGKYRASNLRMFRAGECYNPDPRSLVASPFRYEVGVDDYEEPWSDGVTVFHNPRATFPLDPDVFDDGVHQYLMRSGEMVYKIPGFHVYSSKTMLMLLKDEREAKP